MKEGIHPSYVVAQVSCACGAAFSTRSTRAEIKVEICSQCHPFYTGRQRLVDTAGRLDRFKKRFAKTDGQMVERAPKVAVKPPKLDLISTRTKVLRTTPVKKAPKAEKPAPPKKKAA